MGQRYLGPGNAAVNVTVAITMPLPSPLPPKILPTGCRETSMPISF